jgi:hypothetical protein
MATATVTAKGQITVLVAVAQEKTVASFDQDFGRFPDVQ